LGDKNNKLFLADQGQYLMTASAVNAAAQYFLSVPMQDNVVEIRDLSVLLARSIADAPIPSRDHQAIEKKRELHLLFGSAYRSARLWDLFGHLKHLSPPKHPSSRAKT
jgi:hypothetical protein